MKLVVAVILTAFLAFAAGVYGSLPWWLFAVTSFLVALAIPQKPVKAFLSGFAGLFLLWVILALMKDMENQHLLSVKVAKLLPLGGSYIILILVTGIVGGLVSGLAALTASYVRKS
jgi:hypothetical protein